MHTLKRMESPSNLISPRSEMHIWQTSNHKSIHSQKSGAALRRLFEVHNKVNRGMQKRGAEKSDAGQSQSRDSEDLSIGLAQQSITGRKRSVTNKQ